MRCVWSDYQAWRAAVAPTSRQVGDGGGRYQRRDAPFRSLSAREEQRHEGHGIARAVIVAGSKSPADGRGRARNWWWGAL